jgi:uncharacterized protein YggE
MLNAQVGFRNIGIALCVVAAVLLALNLVVTVPVYSALANAPTKASGDLSTQTGLRELSGTAPLTAQVTGEAEPPKHTISVSGAGTASSKPELVVVYISVVTKGETASDAQSLNAEKADAVVKALKAAGIKEEQMETTGFSLQPMYQWVAGLERSVLVGYECRNSIQVSTEELGRGGEIADLAVSAGANEVSSISFTLKPETVEKLKLEALAKAVEEAKAKVNVVVKAAGITLIGPMTINIDAYMPMPIYYNEAVKAMSASTPIIAPQELSVTATVSMVYEFE